MSKRSPRLPQGERPKNPWPNEAAARAEVRKLALAEFEALFGEPAPEGWVEAWLGRFHELAAEEAKARHLVQSFRKTKTPWLTPLERTKAFVKDLGIDPESEAIDQLVDKPGRLSPCARMMCWYLRDREREIKAPRWDLAQGVESIKREYQARGHPFPDVRQFEAALIWCFEEVTAVRQTPVWGKGPFVVSSLDDRELATVAAVLDLDRVTISPTDVREGRSARYLLREYTKRIKNSRAKHGAADAAASAQAELLKRERQYDAENSESGGKAAEEVTVTPSEKKELLQHERGQQKLRPVLLWGPGPPKHTFDELLDRSLDTRSRHEKGYYAKMEKMFGLAPKPVPAKK